MAVKSAPASMRDGVKATSLPIFISRKSTPDNNIFVGEDITQIRYAEQILGVESELRDRVVDDDLLGYSGLLLHVYADSKIDLSPYIRSTTGVWSAEPIIKGSAAASAIVRQGLKLLKTEPSEFARETLRSIADKVAKVAVTDVRGSIGYAAHLILSPPQDYTQWESPWKNPGHWLVHGTSVDHRLNALYREVVGWAYVHQGDLVAAKKFGVTPAQQAALKQLSLEPEKVYQSICELSRWKTSGMPANVCALLLTNIWSR